MTARPDEVTFSRVFARSNKWTFKIKPIRELVDRHLKRSTLSVDPFAGRSCVADFNNDMSPDSEAGEHMDAVEWLCLLGDLGMRFDLALLDPPYSPRQISEHYKSLGVKVTPVHTQNARMLKAVKNALASVLSDDATVISFGWNSGGMGKTRGFRVVEVLLCWHGAARNDTICTVERKL
jgi:hypothetical protein